MFVKNLPKNAISRKSHSLKFQWKLAFPLNKGIVIEMRYKQTSLMAVQPLGSATLPPFFVTEKVFDEDKSEFLK